AVLGKIEGADGIVQVQIRDALEVPAGAEGAALAPEHSHVGALVGIELLECRHQGVGAPGVHGVARLGAAVDDGPDGAGLLDANGHGIPLGFVAMGSDPLASDASVPVAASARGSDPVLSSGQHSRASPALLGAWQGASAEHATSVLSSTQRRRKINCDNSFPCRAGTCAYVRDSQFAARRPCVGPSLYGADMKAG